MALTQVKSDGIADGAARQLLQTDSAGTGVEWTSDVDVPGTLDVTSTATFDSIASHALGTAGAPTLTFTGDTNTGIYSPGADQVAVATNGTERLHIDSAGLVGIGTSSPVEELDVAAANCTIRSTSTGNSTGKFALNSNRAASTVNGQILGQWNGNTVSRIDFHNGADDTNKDDGEIAFSTSNNASNPIERMRITQAGNVGIGTTSPAYKCDIDVTGSALRLNSTTTSAKLVIRSDDAANATIEFGDESDDDRGAITYDNPNNALIFQANAAERARIDSSGRLLVGTSTSPTDSINILAKGPVGGGGGGGCVGIGYAGSSGPGNGNTLGVLRFTANGNSTHAEIRARQDGATWTDGSDQPSRLVFSTTADGASSPTERMQIQARGQSDFYGNSNVVSARSSSAASNTYFLFTGMHSATGVGNGTTSFRVWTNGNVGNTNNSYGAISDIKLKENIVDATSQWDDLKALQVRNYNFKEGQTHTQIGLVAQEAELVSPGLVYESPDRDAEGNDLSTVTKSVNYSVLYMKAVKALQEAMERIETLEAKVAALESA